MEKIEGLISTEELKQILTNFRKPTASDLLEVDIIVAEYMLDIYRNNRILAAQERGERIYFG